VDAPATVESDTSDDADASDEADASAEPQATAEPEGTEGPEGPAIADPIGPPDNGVAASSPSHRIRIKLDVAGEIFAPAGRDVPPVRRPIAVDARFDFVETGSDEPGRGVTRRYRYHDITTFRAKHLRRPKPARLNLPPLQLTQASLFFPHYCPAPPR
jgi:hypothetical protein